MARLTQDVSLLDLDALPAAGQPMELGTNVLCQSAPLGWNMWDRSRWVWGGEGNALTGRQGQKPGEGNCCCWQRALVSGLGAAVTAGANVLN